MPTVPLPTFAMSPEKFVEAIYQCCLGRSPDVDGMAVWTSLLEATGDPTLILNGVLASPEFTDRSAATSQDCSKEIAAALAFLRRPLRIVDAGAQTIPGTSHAYGSLLDLCEHEIIGFEPIQEKLEARVSAEAGGRLTILPYAVGDGKSYDFHVNNDDGTSSVFALNGEMNRQFNHLSHLQTVKTERMKTHRLDQILPDGPVDFLKLDVQGAELMILKGAGRTLPQTAALHCEVMFSPMYTDQPLFGDIQAELLQYGFELIDLLVEHRYEYLNSRGRKGSDRLLWADTIFFRRTEDPGTLRIQALIAASVYKKSSLAQRLLDAAHLADSEGKL